MSLRGLAVLALLLAAALAVIFWIDRPEAPAVQEGAGLGTLLNLPIETVTALDIAEGGSASRVERRDGKAWQIVTPFGADADPREVEAYLRGLSGAKILRVADEKPRDLGGFGLDAAATAIRVERAKGAAPMLLRIGRHSPVGPERYVTIGDGRVLLADMGGTSVERTAESFRERRLFPVEAEEIRSIVLDRPGGRLALARDGRSWSLIEPVRDLGDYGAADGLARRIAALSCVRLVPPDFPAVSPAAAGGITIAVTTARGETQAVLGPLDPAKERQARRTDTGTTGIVTESDVAELLREAEAFREHRPLSFQAADLEGVRIDGTGVAIALRRDREGGAWSVREGSSDARRADGTKIDELVDRLRWLRASRVEAAPGGAFAAALTIGLETEGKSLGRLEIERIPPAADRKGAPDSREVTVRARSSQRPGCLFEIPASQLEGLPRHAEELLGLEAPGGGERRR